MRKGFTLLELIVVIIIIGILGTLGFTQYVKVLEKGRSAEAKAILGQMRTSAQGTFMETSAWPAALDDLAVEAPADCTGANHYFSYESNGDEGTATRCDAGGKNPPGAVAYQITLHYDTGLWDGTPGYF